MGETENIRAFICIELSDECIKEIAKVQEIIEKRRFQGKLTELGNIHLTLKFLGEIDKDKLSKVQERLANMKFREFGVRLGEIGVFLHNGKPKIIWSKINGKGIFELQKNIDSALEGIFEKENRFMSHVTLARIGYVNDHEEFLRHVKGISIKPVEFVIKEFKLKRSELKRSGSVYSDIRVFQTNQE